MNFQNRLTLPLTILWLLLLTFFIIGLLAPDLFLQTEILGSIIVVIAITGGWISWVSFRVYIRSFKSIHQMSDAIVHGKPIGNKQLELSGIAEVTGENLEKIATLLRQAESFAKDIGDGKLDVDDQLSTLDQPLGNALLGMRSKLSNLADEERIRDWMATGYTRFSDLIQELKGDFHSFGDNFLSELCLYLDMDIGVIYLLEENTPGTIYLKGAYGIDLEKQSNQSIELHGTLIGQVIKEKEVRVIEGLPGGYITARSGLGHLSPHHLLICPVMTPDSIYGVVELATFRPIPLHKQEWIMKVCHDLGVKLGTLQSTAKTSDLLQRTQATNLLMKEQEVALKEQAEALEKAQLLKEKQLDLLENEMAWSGSLTQAIDRTNASLFLDLEGKIEEVNEMFTSVMGYTKEELIGMQELDLLSKDDKQGGQYQLMWENLLAGSYFAGEFRRMHKKGGAVWFRGSYSPIRNSDGEVVKIVKFGRIVSEEKEKALVVKGQLSAVAHAIPTVFLTPEGNLQTPNAAFSKELGYKRIVVRKMQFSELLVDSSDLAEQWSEDKKKLFATGELLSREIVLKHAVGTMHHYQAIFSPIRILTGEIKKAYVILIPRQAADQDLQIETQTFAEL